MSVPPQLVPCPPHPHASSNSTIRVRGPILNSNGKRLELVAEDIDVVEPAD